MRQNISTIVVKSISSIWGIALQITYNRRGACRSGAIERGIFLKWAIPTLWAESWDIISSLPLNHLRVAVVRVPYISFHALDLSKLNSFGATRTIGPYFWWRFWSVCGIRPVSCWYTWYKTLALPQIGPGYFRASWWKVKLYVTEKITQRTTWWLWAFRISSI